MAATASKLGMRSDHCHKSKKHRWQTHSNCHFLLMMQLSIFARHPLKPRASATFILHHKRAWFMTLWELGGTCPWLPNLRIQIS